MCGAIGGHAGQEERVCARVVIERLADAHELDLSKLDHRITNFFPISSVETDECGTCRRVAEIKQKAIDHDTEVTHAKEFIM